jgi:hypothetical protein
MQESCHMLSLCLSGQTHSSIVFIMHVRLTWEGDVRWSSVAFDSLEAILEACFRSVGSMDPKQRNNCCWGACHTGCSLLLLCNSVHKMMGSRDIVGQHQDVGCIGAELGW